MLQRLRYGFTLIELLVVIAIIAILIALLVPAVQKVREAAARTQCVNNMKQLGLAIHNYHSAYKSFPAPCIVTTSGAGNCCSTGYGFPNISGLYTLLPYIEQDALFKQFDYVNGAQCCNSGAAPYWSGVTLANGIAAQNDVPTFICPSDPNTLVQVTGRCGMYADNATWANWRSGGTNYIFSAGTGSAFNWHSTMSTNLRPDLGGIFSPNTMRGVKDVTDGTSNTLAFGEVTWIDHANNVNAGNGNGGKPSWSHGYFTQITFTTGGGINALYTCPTGTRPFNLTGPPTTSTIACGTIRNAGLQSMHVNGANVCLADGSVRFLSQSIQQTTLDSLATRANNDIPGDF